MIQVVAGKDHVRGDFCFGGVGDVGGSIQEDKAGHAGSLENLSVGKQRGVAVRGFVVGLSCNGHVEAGGIDCIPVVGKIDIAARERAKRVEGLAGNLERIACHPAGHLGPGGDEFCGESFLGVAAGVAYAHVVGFTLLQGSAVGIAEGHALVVRGAGGDVGRAGGLYCIGEGDISRHGAAAGEFHEDYVVEVHAEAHQRADEAEADGWILGSGGSHGHEGLGIEAAGHGVLVLREVDFAGTGGHIHALCRRIRVDGDELGGAGCDRACEGDCVSV